MSLHPSLRVDAAGTQQRSVLTRIERIKDLMKKGLWTDEHAVVGLPKTKVVRVKSKKTVKAKEEPAAGATPAATPAAAAAAPAAKAKEAKK